MQVRAGKNMGYKFLFGLLFCLLQSFTLQIAAIGGDQLQTLENAFQNSPKDRSLGKNLGKAYLSAQKPLDACKIFESLSESQPADAEAHYLYGEALLQNKKYAEAALELKRAFNLDQKKMQYSVRAGEALLAAKRYDELSEWSSSALSKNPDPASKITLEWLQKAARDRMTLPLLVPPKGAS